MNSCSCRDQRVVGADLEVIFSADGLDCAWLFGTEPTNDQEDPGLLGSQTGFRAVSEFIFFAGFLDSARSSAIV